MNLHDTTSTHLSQLPVPNVQSPKPLHSQKPIPKSKQQTLWNYVQQKIVTLQVTPDSTTTADLTPKLTQTPPSPNPTLPSMPLITLPPSSSQLPYKDNYQQSTQMQQHPLNPGEWQNKPWGNCWALNQPTNLFCIISKSTGTINLQNLDMQAITNSTFWMQVSLQHRKPTSTGMKIICTTLLVAQCHHTTPQVKIATSTSMETMFDWYKPGGTPLLHLKRMNPLY